MKTNPTLKIYDDANSFRAVILNGDDLEREVYKSKESFTKLLNNISSILNIPELSKIIEYGDETAHNFTVLMDKTDTLSFSHLEQQLINILKTNSEQIVSQGLAKPLTNELYDNLISDLSASVFDSSVYQMLVFIINLAKDLNIENITFESDLMNIVRFKKIITSELNKYDLTLL